MKIEIDRIKQQIYELEIEADACDEIGSLFSASSYRDEIERLNKLIADIPLQEN